MVVPMPIATPSTAAMIGLLLCASEYRNFVAFEARGVSVFEVPAFRKSSRSLPAVNTPEPPVIMKQRISGLFCAVSIASLIKRYISCVIAFFFSGRRMVITRAWWSSATIRCSVITIPRQTRRRAAAGESEAISYMIRSRAQAASRRFSRRTGMNKRRCMCENVARHAMVRPAGLRPPGSSRSASFGRHYLGAGAGAGGGHGRRLAEQPALQPVEVDVDHRRRIQRENLRHGEAADD